MPRNGGPGCAWTCWRNGRGARWDALAARLPELDALEFGPPEADRRQLLHRGEAAAALAALAGQ